MTLVCFTIQIWDAFLRPNDESLDRDRSTTLVLRVSGSYVWLLGLCALTSVLQCAATVSDQYSI